MFQSVLATLRDFAAFLREDAREWCEGKSPWWRIILLVYFFYAGMQHMFGSEEYSDWFKGITLAFHELGHILFSPFSYVWMILGGSLTQVLVPIIAGLYLLFLQRDYFGVAFTNAWLAFSLWDLAVYVGDASYERLPLVSMGGTPEHDWSILLTRWHVLNHDAKFAFAIRVVAFVVWILSVALGAWLAYWMRRHEQASKDP